MGLSHVDWSYLGSRGAGGGEDCGLSGEFFGSVVV